jgi:hypothetical protein
VKSLKLSQSAGRITVLNWCLLMRLGLLNASTVFAYLRSKRLLDQDAVDQIRVLDLSRRNHNLAVTMEGGPSWFIKQLQYDTPEVVASLAREASCYQAAREGGPLASLESLMPRCAEFDAANSILILQCLDGVDAAEADRRAGPFSQQVAKVIGRLVATLHAATPCAVSISASKLFPQDLPWVLRPSCNAPSGSRRSQFLSLFETDRAVERALGELRGSWRRDTLIHGDTRLENFIFCSPAEDQADFEGKLVDWELADIGDAAWDCAGVMQHYWTQWTTVTPSDPQVWKALSSALAAFWIAYTTLRGVEEQDSGRLFRRATLFTGARLIQTAYEQSASSGGTAPVVQRLSRLASLLLVDPRQALQGFEWCRDAA